MMRIVKDQAGRFEADAMLSLVDPVFSFVPGKFHNGLCVDEYVYTITRLSTGDRVAHSTFDSAASLKSFSHRGRLGRIGNTRELGSGFC